MMYLWNNIHQVKKYLKPKSPLIVFLDFDGTLVPIQKHPDDVNLTSKTRDVLTELSNKKNIIPAIISGRQIDDLKRKIGLPDLLYGGNYGLESETETHYRAAIKVQDEWFKTLIKIKKDLKKLEKSYKGAFVEDKKVALSFHYRNIENKHMDIIKIEFIKIMRTYEESATAKVISGKKVYDIHPNIISGKEHFAKKIVEKIHKKRRRIPLTIFIGDDVADEAAFKTLTEGINIRVGKKNTSVANYFLNDSHDVYEFLSWLANHYEDNLIHKFGKSSASRTSTEYIKNG